MDEPPRKRRKTSSPVPPPSSPLRKPPRRPSFASPTKASLARNYPNLLPTRTSPRQDTHARGQQTLELSVDGAGPSPKDVEASSKRPPRAFGALRRSPLAEAPSVQQNQLIRPAEEALDTEGQEKGTEKPPLDPVLEKKKQERARLQREVEELEAHVSRCTDEIQAEQQRAADVALPHAKRADLIKFVVRVSGEDVQEERPTPVSSLLCSFLPFSALTIPPAKQSRPEKPIASHRPIELKDPLPYLEMFTSFSLSTQLGLPESKLPSSSRRVHQKHTINISGPRKLLTAQLIITIDCLSNELVDMHVVRLPSWAERELGTFMRAKAKEKDLGNACWAIDSFWDIATKRAQYWHRCEKEFAKLLPRRTIADTEDTAATATKSSTLSRKDLSRHLGRDMLILQDKHVLLKINWRIMFDWTGEAESNVEVECAVPAVWKEADASGTFSKVPETFDSLCRTKGVFEATRIMVALLFSQS